MALSHSLRGVFPCYLYRLIGHEQLYLNSLGAGSIKWSHRQLNLVKFGTRQVHFTPFCGPTCDRIVTVSKDCLKSVSRSIERCVFEWNSSKIDRLVAVASKRPDVTADETFSTNLHVRIGSDLHSPASVKAFWSTIGWFSWKSKSRRLIDDRNVRRNERFRRMTRRRWLIIIADPPVSLRATFGQKMRNKWENVRQMRGRLTLCEWKWRAATSHKNLPPECDTELLLPI